MAVTKFVINDNPSIAKGLDSVFFTIDLDNRLIFNADSLPKGTDVTSLIVSITYPRTVSSAIVRMDGTKRQGEFDYLRNPSDTIDFTGRVTLTLYSADAESSFTYLLKVNVHNENPDSICWSRMENAALPSRMPAPLNQKTVTYKDKVVSMIQEADGTYTLSQSTDPGAGEWSKASFSPGFTPDIRSFSAADDALYILDADGHLLKSDDALSWTDTGAVWKSVLGGYGEKLLGIRDSGAGLLHTAYPLGEMTEQEVASGFPVQDATNLCTFSSKWAVSPTAILAGGIDADGNMLSATWAFDGKAWTSISEYSIPPLAGASIAPYYIYRQKSNVLATTEHSIWMITGGRAADGTFNKDTYISYDGGVNWRKGSSLVSLPDFMPGMRNADLVVFDTPMSGDFRPKAWTRALDRKAPARLPYITDGYLVEWNCPYLYFFGGRIAGGTMSDRIWRGVLNRLKYMPIL